MTPQQQIGPEQKKQLEQQLEKVKLAITLKQRQIELKAERACAYSRLYDLATTTDADTEDSELNAWASIYALDAAAAANDAELLKLDLGDMEAAIVQLETILRAVGSGLVVATAQVPKGLGSKHGR
jgi:hypothetical protein